MSDAAVIHAVFKEIFGQEANFYEFDDRLKAQKAVFLLQELGVSCGDYSFGWYKHGPYSQQLQNTLISPYSEQADISFSDAGKSAIGKVKAMLNVPHADYSDATWLEAIGSIRYLKARWYQTATKDSILKKLSELKPNLDNNDLNVIAYDALEKYGKV